MPGSSLRATASPGERLWDSSTAVPVSFVPQSAKRAGGWAQRKLTMYRMLLHQFCFGAAICGDKLSETYDVRIVINITLKVIYGRLHGPHEGPSMNCGSGCLTEASFRESPSSLRLHDPGADHSWKLV